MRRSSFLFLVCLIVFSCSPSKHDVLREGAWRGILFPDTADVTLELPFNFEVFKKDSSLQLTIINAGERISVEEITTQGDSVFIKMPVFDSEFKCKDHGDSMTGVWINHAKKVKNIIAFKAYHNQYNRFGLIKENEASSAFDGKWEVEFSPGTADAYKAIGEFSKMDEVAIGGTFLTETGDYRYLQGISTKDELMLSCFDGAHAFLFKAKRLNDGTMSGMFWSGMHWKEPWIAKRNYNFELRNADSLTFLKPGSDKIDFKFKNLQGKEVALSDEKFKNKVVIVEIMGTWCPNCMDETEFLSGVYEKYKDRGLEIIGLAFERTDDFNKAVANVERMKRRFNANYEFLITGKANKEQASEALPMLNQVMSFPTSIFVDRKGKVRKIYTGYNGPATGKHYDDFVKETTTFIEVLLGE